MFEVEERFELVFLGGSITSLGAAPRDSIGAITLARKSSGGSSSYFFLSFLIPVWRQHNVQRRVPQCY